MRLLHCIRSLNPAGGGPIEALRLRIDALAGHGVASEVASLDDPAALWLRDFPASVHALGSPGMGVYGYSSRWVPWLRANHHRFDAVIINGLWQYNGFGTRQALPPGFPYFVYPHGMLDPWFKRTYPLKHLKKWLYWPWADYRVLRDARAVFFTSEEERLQAKKSFWLYRCNEHVVNYGTTGPVGDPEKQREQFLRQFPQLQGKRRLLFLGRVHTKKGPDLLLRAFANVLKRLPSALTRNVQLVMAGPNNDDYGCQMAALAGELGLGERVTWTGMVTGDQKWGAFHSADAFVLPSHQENFGISVAEALACGVPVLISNQVNIWREIAADKAGLVENDDLNGTVRLLEQWLGAPDNQWAAMRECAKACYQARFNIELAASSLVRAMESCGVRGRG